MDLAEKIIDYVTGVAFQQLLEAIKNSRDKSKCLEMLEDEFSQFYKNHPDKYVDSISFEEFITQNTNSIIHNTKLYSATKLQTKAIEFYTKIAKAIAKRHGECFGASQKHIVSDYCLMVVKVYEHFCDPSIEKEVLTVAEELLNSLDGISKEDDKKYKELKSCVDRILANQITFQYTIDHIPPVMNNTKPLHYSSKVIERLIGRTHECTQLDRFMNQRCKVSVWGIKGPGGVGKNKLVYEFIKPYVENGWVFRIVDYSKVDLFNSCNDWDYNKDLCLVIDYSEFVKEQILLWLNKLSVKSERRKKLRIILLSRVADSFEYELKKYGNICYENPGFLKLSMFSLEESIELANRYSEYIRECPLNESEESIIRLSIQNNLSKDDYRPLFILIISMVSLSKRKNTDVMNWIEICDYSYERDRIELKSLIKDNDIRLALNNLVMFSTICGKTPMTDDNSFISKDVNLLNDYLLKNEKDFTSLSIEMTGRCEKDIWGEYTLFPKTPDIIGEYYVLKKMKNCAFPLARWVDYMVRNHTKSSTFWLRAISDFASYSEFDALFCRLFRTILKNEFFRTSRIDIYPLISYYLDLCSYEAFQKLFPLLQVDNRIENRLMKKYVDSWIKTCSNKNYNTAKVEYVCETYNYCNADISSEIVTSLRKLRDNSNSSRKKALFCKCIETVLQKTEVTVDVQKSIYATMKETLGNDTLKESSDVEAEDNMVAAYEENRLITRGYVLDSYLRGFQPWFSATKDSKDFVQALMVINQLCEFVFTPTSELGVFEAGKRRWCGIPVVMKLLTSLCIVSKDDISFEERDNILTRTCDGLIDSITDDLLTRNQLFITHVKNAIDNFLLPQNTSTWKVPYQTVYLYFEEIDCMLMQNP